MEKLPEVEVESKFITIPSTGLLYEVNEYGTIRNYETKKEISQNLDTNKYYQVNLWLDGKNRSKKVHRLVAECFVSNPEKYNCVDHIDGNKTNNHKSNLRWCTIRQNNEFYRLSGGKYGCNLSNEEIIDIYLNYNSPNEKRIAVHKYKIDIDTVGNIKSGKTLSHITGKAFESISRSVIKNNQNDPAMKK